jgi:hypothetical protein
MSSPRHEEKAGPLIPMHSDICRCHMCMRNRVPRVSESEYREFTTMMVDRRNPDDPVRPLMKSHTAHYILNAGESVDMLTATGLSPESIPSRTDIQMKEPSELKRFRAEWKNRDQELAKSGRDASVFGGQGVMLAKMQGDVIKIPTMNALATPPKFLEKYGASLVPLADSITLEKPSDPTLEKLYMVEYDFDPEYIAQYVMHEQGGGGIFVERHPFPHIFTPLSENCKGSLILGVDNNDGTFDFAAFEIPFGYSLKINSNVIHGDSYFTGRYAIALTETELADTVLFKQPTPERDIQPVIPTPCHAVTLPLLAEHRLAQKVNHKMMIEKIRKEGAGQGVKFFRQFPAPILDELRADTPEAQKAYVEKFAVVPYKKL